MSRIKPVPRSHGRGGHAPTPDQAIVRSLAAVIGRRSVALLHEWVVQRAGSELTFERLAQLIPSARLVTLSWEPSALLDVPQTEVEVSVLDGRLLRGRRSLTLPIMPSVWRSLGRSHREEIVVSSSHAFSRCFAATARPEQHLSYVYTPARYLWFPEADARASAAPRRLVSVLQEIDKRSAQHAELAVISSAIHERVQEVYGRPAEVIPPPVDVDFFAERPGGARPREHLLSVGRWISYKRHDLAIDAAIQLGIPIVVAGGGPLERQLRSMAARSDLVTLCPNPTDGELRSLYQGAIALLYPAHEDFGIVPVEAQAAGTPVVALGIGGARDTVIDGLTGVLVREQSAEAFAAGVRRLLDDGVDPAHCRAHAGRFSYQAFDERVSAWITAAIS